MGKEEKPMEAVMVTFHSSQKLFSYLDYLPTYMKKDNTRCIGG